MVGQAGKSKGRLFDIGRPPARCFVRPDREEFYILSRLGGLLLQDALIQCGEDRIPDQTVD